MDFYTNSGAHLDSIILDHKLRYHAIHAIIKDMRKTWENLDGKGLPYDYKKVSTNRQTRSTELLEEEKTGLVGDPGCQNRIGYQKYPKNRGNKKRREIPHIGGWSKIRREELD